MSTVTLLTGPPQLTRFDQRRWVLHCPSGHEILVNQATVKLLHLLEGAKSLEDGWDQFKLAFSATVSREEFERLLTSRLGGYQLLLEDQVAVRPPVASPIHHQLELLPRRWAGWLARPFTHLYRPAVFWPGLAGISLALLGLYQAQPVLPTLPASGWGVALFYFSVPVHELGHIAACRRAGVPHGGIGVGMYYFFPVLYADITGIWHAGRHARIIANLGGIFSQLLYAGSLALVGVLLHNGVAVLVAEAVAVSAAWQLNPFMQHDGYWIVADLSNTPNLLSRSYALRRQLATRQGLRRLWARPLAERRQDPRTWVVLYGLVNTSLLLTILGYALYHSRHVLPLLPDLAHTILSKLLQGTLTLADIPAQTLTVLAVYGWLLRRGIGRIFRARTRLAVPG